MTPADDIHDRIKTALGAMTAGPRPLSAYLSRPGPDFNDATARELSQMFDLILSPNPNEVSRVKFSDLLRSWDNIKESKWTDGTPRNTSQRRGQIHKLLKSEAELKTRIDTLLPFFQLDEPLIIAEEHEEWYKPDRGIKDYYWRTYVAYLKGRGVWNEASLLNLDNSTRSILECLSNPESKIAYSSRGLVMGYVQSGKTANFAGVVARAADAGYRLIIVLGGTWNILRNQTQRRFDKELLGKELLQNDESYLNKQPADWDDFLEHGTHPTDLGQYSWQRLTRPDIDFRGLKAAIDNLEFERRNKAIPLYHPDNLHNLPAKLLVVKKNSAVLNKLVGDLKKLSTRLSDLPALVIDDESDQAGLNTIDPTKATKDKERTATNLAITKLLGLLPRGQYVGYSATPYANALVNPDDPEDLFPKDFIVSLDRPIGYMGISDFFDPYTDYSDLEERDFTQPEIAYIRRVASPPGDDDEDLMKALRSYVIAGAVKIYRNSQNPKQYGDAAFRHHTMLIHTSSRKGEHTSLAERILELWDHCAFNSPLGLAELGKLWESDFLPTCKAQGANELTPHSFNDLKPHLSRALQKITKGTHFVRVVNSDKDEAPDFTMGPVWQIVVGGNKLSRGYTVEGLTVSYYRRISNTADTLMQMGRWFGFRPGYRDLVRVFLGVKEGAKGKSDLVALFKEVCRMEERFRGDIKKYVRRPGVPNITPKQIPPLISISGNLPPTARNKRFNAVVKNKNFGGSWSMPTLTASKEENLRENITSLGNLLSQAEVRGPATLGGRTNAPKPDSVSVKALLFQTSTSALVKFLTEYIWLEDEFKYPARPADTDLQLDFLKHANHGITSWLIIAPQRIDSFGDPLEINKLRLTVKQRGRLRGFKVFGESPHRAVAEYLLDLNVPDKLRIEQPNSATEPLLEKTRGVMLLYPVRENEKDVISIGFELLFPENNLPYDLNLTVERKDRSAKIVIEK